MKSMTKRHKNLFLAAFAQGMGAGVFSLDRHPISGLRQKPQSDSFRRDLENIGGDFTAAIRKEKARHSTAGA